MQPTCNLTMHGSAKAALCIFVGVVCLLLVGGANRRAAEELDLLTAPAGVGSLCGRGLYPSAWDAARLSCEAGTAVKSGAWDASMRSLLAAPSLAVGHGCSPNCTFAACVHPSFVNGGRVSTVIVGMGGVVAASSLNMTADGAVVFVSALLRSYVPRWRARLTAELVAANLVVQSPHFPMNGSDVERVCGAAYEA